MEPLLTSRATLTEDDYLAFVANATSQARRRSLTLYGILLAFSVLAIILIFNRTGEISMLCVFVIFIFTCLLAGQLLWKGQARKLYHTHKMMQDSEMTFKFYDDHLVFSNEYDISKIPYYKLYKIEITRTHVFLYTGIGGALILRNDDPEVSQFLSGIRHKYNLVD